MEAWKKHFCSGGCKFQKEKRVRLWPAIVVVVVTVVCRKGLRQ